MRQDELLKLLEGEFKPFNTFQLHVKTALKAGILAGTVNEADLPSFIWLAKKNLITAFKNDDLSNDSKIVMKIEGEVRV